jgi:transposase InsO family protein
MPWKETNVMDQRLEFVLKSFEKSINFTKLCAEYGISTKCGYKWKERFIQEGLPGLRDQKRAPNNSPNKISKELIFDLIKLKNKKKFWGAKKILEIYSNMHPNQKMPCRTTVERLFEKAGLTEKKKRRIFRHSGERISNPKKAMRANHVWTVDFKGWWYTPDKEKCNPLTVRDEYSKYILCIKTMSKGDVPSVKAEFARLFKIYGLPEIIRSDNGPPFASNNGLKGLTRLSVWWLSLGIKLDRIDPGKPYQNGSHERMHKDMKRELENQIIGNITLHQKMFDKWRKEYNRERPHEALNMKTPEKVYEKSKVAFDPDAELLLQYPAKYRSRMVNSRGYINWRGIRVMIGNAFGGYNVGIKTIGNVAHVWLGTNFLGTIPEGATYLIAGDEISD